MGACAGGDTRLREVMQGYQQNRIEAFEELYGLGAGLMADAGWRLFCEFSGPAHVFPFHVGAIAANTLCGVVSAALLAGRRN